MFKVENNGAAIYVGKSATVHKPLFYTTAEYLNRKVSIGQLLQHISKSIMVFARSSPKMLKTYSKELVWLHNHSPILTLVPSSSCSGYDDSERNISPSFQD